MKNNKNGFTLIEVLAIIIILAVILAVAAPSMTKEIKKKKDTDSIILNEKIENASKLYAAKYYTDRLVDLPNNTSDEITFTLRDLEQDGLISLKNGVCSTASNVSDDTKNVKIRYDVSHRKIEYNYDELKTLDNCYK